MEIIALLSMIMAGGWFSFGFMAIILLLCLFLGRKK